AASSSFSRSNASIAAATLGVGWRRDGRVNKGVSIIFLKSSDEPVIAKRMASPIESAIGGGKALAIWRQISTLLFSGISLRLSNPVVPGLGANYHVSGKPCRRGSVRTVLLG